MKRNYYIGLDVHKEKIAIAYARGGERKAATYHGNCGGSNSSVERALRALAKKLDVPFKELHVCYEAGPTGFPLARRLRRLGLHCVVVAPSRTERKPGERIKTDKRDAKKLAKLFRNGDVTEVRVPPSTDEAMRDLCRARTDAVEALRRLKQQLTSFLLRNGFRYSGKTNWTDAHQRYLRELELPHQAQKIILEESIQGLDAAIERVDRLEEKMLELLEEWEWAPVVLALMSMKGFKEVAAMTVIAELGDLTRFDHPKELMAFLGLVPSEDSSGQRRRQGAITKCGNSHARWMLVESAHAYRYEPKVSAQLSRRQEGQPKKIKQLSWRTQVRLSSRYKRLKLRGKHENVAIIAVAREPSGTR